MGKVTKQILKEVDKLIASGKTPPKKVVRLLEDISDDLETRSKAREKKDKDKLMDKVFDKFDSLEKALKEGKMDTKEVLASINKAISSIKSPEIKVGQPKVEVTVPKIKIPKPPPVKVVTPKRISINKPAWLPSLASILKKLDALKPEKLPTKAKDAIAVRLSDGEKFYRAVTGLAKSVAGSLMFKKADNSASAALVDDDGHAQVDVLNQLVPENYDYIALTYVASGNGAGEIEKVTYKEGGSGGEIAATLTLAYDASDNLINVTKT
ncbi:MAG: hypothetical protein KAS32_08695 [Candidatus Peribacteraceae bacterium]|nr:hypothetical protein [Candidatus Peribacteraceae bacterium]